MEQLQKQFPHMQNQHELMFPFLFQFSFFGFLKWHLDKGRWQNGRCHLGIRKVGHSQTASQTYDTKQGGVLKSPATNLFVLLVYATFKRKTAN
jgi:hypothetical protein